MTAKILFHPRINAADAHRIAREQGCRLVWRSSRQHIINAIRHTDHAAEAAEAADYLTSLEHLRAARNEIERGMPCAI